MPIALVSTHSTSLVDLGGVHARVVRMIRILVEERDTIMRLRKGRVELHFLDNSVTAKLEGNLDVSR